MEESRVYRIVLSENNGHYEILEKYCHESKNLYNYANYILRNKYQEKEYELFNFYKLREYIRNDKTEDNPWTRQATTHIGAETLRILVNNWNGYFAASEDYKKNPEKYKSRPKPPGYLPKNGTYQMILDTTNFKFDGEIIRFPKAFSGISLEFNKSKKVNQVRVIPQYNHIIIEVVYKVEVPDYIEDNQRYYSIDLGVSNFATITTNVVGIQPVIVNGKGLKSINQYYNKKKAHYQEIAERLGQGKHTNMLVQLTWKRNQKVYDFMHKVSRYIADLANQNDISCVVCGYNKEWKQDINLGTITNQKFVQIPYQKFISMLEYKLADYGIQLVLTEESYTSKTSFLDGEHPNKQEEYAGKRVCRGLFKSKVGKKINADVNGSYQILKKVFPNVYSNGIEGISLCPVKVGIC